MIPALRDAANDMRLQGPPLSIYLHLLYEVLDLRDFRSVKRIVLARQLKISEKTAQRALSLLVDRGYIERGPVDVTEARTYRLVYSRVRAA